MASAFKAINAQEIDAELDGGLGVADGSAFVKDGAAGGFQLFDDGARAVAGGFDDADAGVDDGLGVALEFFSPGGVVEVREGRREVVVRTVVVGGDEGGEEGQVYGEGVGGHGAAAGDLFGEVRGGGLR